jgi:hypothetical protein
VQNVSNIAGSASIGCSIASNTLTCTATTGSVTFASNSARAASTSSFTHDAAEPWAFQNPRSGGSAQIDPRASCREQREQQRAGEQHRDREQGEHDDHDHSDDPDPSLSGQSVTVAWSVTVNAPGSLGAALTGNVTVSDGTTTCSAAVSAGQCSLALATGGNHNLTATYAGDGNYNGSASATAAHTVNLAAPTIAKAFAPATIAAGGSTTVTLTLANSNAVAADRRRVHRHAQRNERRPAAR